MLGEYMSARAAEDRIAELEDALRKPRCEICEGEGRLPVEDELDRVCPSCSGLGMFPWKYRVAIRSVLEEDT